MLTGGANATLSFPIDQCVVPEGINGPVAIFITSDNQPLNTNVVDRQNQTVVAGPLMTFIDSIPDPLASVVRNTSATSSASVTSDTPAPSQVNDGVITLLPSPTTYI